MGDEALPVKLEAVICSINRVDLSPIGVGVRPEPRPPGIIKCIQVAITIL